MLFLTLSGTLLLGLLSGTIVNYLADVLPFSRKFTAPICTHCYKPQNWLDYILQKDCSFCNAPKSWRNELTVMSFIAVLLYFQYDPPARLGLWVGTLLLIYFGVVIIVDLEHRVILDQVSIAGVILAIAIGTWRHGIVNTLLGGIAGFGIMLLLYYTGIWYTRWVTRKRGQELDDQVALGFGDVNLGGILGLLLGWPGIIAGLLYAIILGGVVSLILIIVLAIRRKWKSSWAIPYAPFLILGAGLLLYLR